MSDRQYGREDVDYHTWYSDWMKMLARTKTRQELQEMYYGAAKEGKSATRAHLRTIEKTHSMQSQSQARSHMRNIVSASGDTKIAIDGALEIYDLFPEYTKEYHDKL
jgi:hypothetical protein